MRLNLLSKFNPQILKLDMELCQGVATDRVKKTITQGTIATAHALDIKVIAEGVEQKEDLDVLIALGVDYFQGYIFAKPAVEALPAPDFSVL